MWRYERMRVMGGLLSLQMWMLLSAWYALGLEKLEPYSGCYIGAFIEKDDVVRGDIKLFEQLTGKKHASYFTYVGYGRPFPLQWARKVIEANAIPHIAWEPNDGLHVVRDDEYLRTWARCARSLNFPIFLRFASEMNGDWSAYYGNPPEYIAKWRLVARVMRDEAPNVVMLWAPFCMPRSNIDDYYPGDEYVDWVGVNVYSVYCHDGDPNKPAYFEDPVELIRPVYDTYASRKPIAIAEYAATHFCRGTNRDTTDFAIEKMLRLYSALATELPRVKMINWLSMNTIAHGVADNDYCLTNNAYILTAYRELIASSYFLSEPVLGEWFFMPSLRRPSVARASMASARQVTSVVDTSTKIIAPSKPICATPPELLRGPYGITIKGLRKGERIRISKLIWLHVPDGINLRIVSYSLDGRVLAIINRQPYWFRLRPDGHKAGRHWLKVSAMLSTGELIEFPAVPIEFVGD